MDLNTINDKVPLSVLKDIVISVVSELQKSNLDSAVKVYTILEVAKLLKCKERTVKHHLHEKKDLKYLKVGREVRILESDLIKFLENNLIPCVTDQEILQ